jgi:hypothetical protein
MPSSSLASRYAEYGAAVPVAKSLITIPWPLSKTLASPAQTVLPNNRRTPVMTVINRYLFFIPCLLLKFKSLPIYASREMIDSPMSHNAISKYL